MKRKLCCSGLIQYQKMFKALGDLNRLKLLGYFCEKSKLKSAVKELNVKELTTCCEVDFSVVSRHLSVLKDANMVTSNKRGKEVYYRLNVEEIVSSLNKVTDFISKHCKVGDKYEEDFRQ